MRTFCLILIGFLVGSVLGGNLGYKMAENFIQYTICDADFTEWVEIYWSEDYNSFPTGGKGGKFPLKTTIEWVGIRGHTLYIQTKEHGEIMNKILQLKRFQ